MKARWLWSRWLLPPCDDEIHHSCREAERKFQACGEETLMTAVNSVSFYFHAADIAFTLRHRQGFPCFHVAATRRRSRSISRTSLWWGSALISLVLILLVGWSFVVVARVTDGRLSSGAAAWGWNLVVTNSWLSGMNSRLLKWCCSLLLIGLLLWWLFWKVAEW